MHDPRGYSKLAMEGAPDIIELKGYSWLGESKQRLPISAMPYQSEINEFAKEMAKATGYELLAEDPVSRVALLVRDVRAAGLSLDLHEG
jgi:tRNA wybutosine-synthesizing protein 1